MILKNRKRKNLIYSTAMSIVKTMVDSKKIELINYLAETYASDIKLHRIEWERCFMDMMKYYRNERDKDMVSEPVEGEFGSGSSYAGKSQDNSMMDDELNSSASSMNQSFPKYSPGRNSVPLVIIDDELELKKMTDELVISRKHSNEKASEYEVVTKENTDLSRSETIIQSETLPSKKMSMEEILSDCDDQLGKREDLSSSNISNA